VNPISVLTPEFK